MTKKLEAEETPSRRSPHRESPQVYGVRRNRGGWSLGRRRFLAAAAAAGAALARPRAGKSAENLGESTTGAAKKGISCQGVNAHIGYVFSPVFNSDGTLLATGSSDNTVKLWSVPLWNLEATLKGHSGWVKQVAFSPDGQWLAAGDNDGWIYIWELKKRKLYKKFNVYFMWVTGLVITTDSKYLISCGIASGNENCIRLWSLPDGGLVKGWAANASGPIALSPNGSVLASAGTLSNAIALWSMKSGEQGKLIKQFGSIFDMKGPESLVFTPDGNKLVSASLFDERVRFWNVPEGTLSASFVPHGGQFPGVQAIAFNSKGNLFATSPNDFEERVCIWRYPGFKKKKTLGQGDEDFTSCTALAFNPDEDLLFCCSHDSVSIWSCRSGKLMRCLIDLVATYKSLRGRTYRYKGSNGKRVTVTVPDCQCAPAPPEKATCICDTVAGERKGGGGGGCGVVYYYPN